MPPPVSLNRIADLLKLRCSIYQQLYNPLNIRTGSKVLRQRLRGASIASYYPRRMVSMVELQGMYPELETYDDDEADREDNIVLLKARGKGAPKKKRTAEESKKFAKRGGRPGGAVAKAPPT